MKRGIWLDKIKNTYPYVYKDMECDVIIIGGGICGAINAFFLAKDGFKVVVIEKNIIGYNNTSVSSACISDFVDELYIKYISSKDKNITRKIYDLKKKSDSLLNEILVDIGMHNDAQKINYNIVNTRLFQKGALNQELNIRNDIGQKVQKSEKGNVINIEESARIINPYEFTSRVFEYISRFPNVSIFENTEVKEINSSYDNVSVVTQNDFNIIASSLIVTTNLEQLPISNLPNIDIYKRFSVSIKSDILNNKKAIKVLNDIPIYIRIDEKGNIVASGIDTKYISKMENTKYLDLIEKENSKKIMSVLYKLYPKAEFSNEIYAHSGNIFMSKDNLPLISEIPNMPNVYVNIGMGSSSISQMLVGADILKEALKGYYKKEMNLFKLSR